MTLADFTTLGLVGVPLLARDAQGVIGELATVLHREGCVPDAGRFQRLAWEREQLVSTAVGGGMALPHAREPGLARLTFALGRTAEPLRWGATGGPVRLVFLLAVPEHEIGSYLQVISGLARLGQDTALVQGLLGACDGEAMLGALQRVEVRNGSRAARTATGRSQL